MYQIETKQKNTPKGNEIHQNKTKYQTKQNEILKNSNLYNNFKWYIVEQIHEIKKKANYYIKIHTNIKQKLQGMTILLVGWGHQETLQISVSMRHGETTVEQQRLLKLKQKFNFKKWTLWTQSRNHTYFRKVRKILLYLWSYITLHKSKFSWHILKGWNACSYEPCKDFKYLHV